MKRPSFFEGVGVALAASISGVVFLTLLATLFAGGFVLRALVAVLGLLYMLYLIGRSGEPVGRITSLAVWLCAAFAIWLLGLSLPLYLLAHLGLVWLVRSLYYHASLIAAFADLGLILLGVAGGLWAWLVTGSPALSLWCFFLLQALFVLIPASLKRRTSRQLDPAASTDRFQHAYRVAEAAVARLANAR